MKDAKANISQMPSEALKTVLGAKDPVRSAETPSWPTTARSKIVRITTSALIRTASTLALSSTDR